MKKNIPGVLFFIAIVFAANAQTPIDKGLQSITKQKAEATINFLASDELRGREAGTPDGQVAARYLASRLQDMDIAPLGETYFQPFIAVQPVDNIRSASRWQSHPDSVSAVSQKKFYRKINLRNVLGIIPGVRSDEYVIVGAHYDHLGIDPQLAGDAIFNGADDNASGVSAVLQIARAFRVSGKKPERTVIIAFWDGEEKGLLGAQYFVAAYPKISRVKSYLNFDMIGRNNDEAKPQHVVFFYTAANKVFGQWLKNDIQQYKLRLQPDYRAWDNPVGGSDNGPFAKVGIPILWYHTDGHPDYHRVTDEPHKLNWDKLVEITKAAFLNAWNMANEKTY